MRTLIKTEMQINYFKNIFRLPNVETIPKSNIQSPTKNPYSFGPGYKAKRNLQSSDAVLGESIGKS